jgi:hypothetical protein
MNRPLNSIGIDPTTGLRSVERYEVIQEELRTNTVALTDSTQLVCTIGAGETLVWECFLNFGGNSPGNGKFGFFTPAAPASGGFFSVGTDAVPAQVIQRGTLAAYNVLFSTIYAQAANDEVQQMIWGRLVNGVNLGQFSVQWAQNAANATPTKLLIGSYLNVWRR